MYSSILKIQILNNSLETVFERIWSKWNFLNEAEMKTISGNRLSWWKDLAYEGFNYADRKTNWLYYYLTILNRSFTVFLTGINN